MAALSHPKSGVSARAPAPVERLLRLDPMAILGQLRREPFAVWTILGYLFVEYVRPQSIIRGMDVLPWGKLFIYASFGAMLLSPKTRWVRDATNIWMVLFLIVLVASGFLAIWPSVAKEHWFDFVGWFVIYFLIINIVINQ